MSPMFRRVGHDDAYTANMPANANPEFWEPVDAAPVEETAPSEAPAAETEESE